MLLMNIVVLLTPCAQIVGMVSEALEVVYPVSDVALNRVLMVLSSPDRRVL